MTMFTWCPSYDAIKAIARGVWYVLRTYDWTYIVLSIFVPDVRYKWTMDMFIHYVFMMYQTYFHLFWLDISIRFYYLIAYFYYRLDELWDNYPDRVNGLLLFLLLLRESLDPSYIRIYKRFTLVSVKCIFLYTRDTLKDMWYKLKDMWYKLKDMWYGLKHIIYLLIDYIWKFVLYVLPFIIEFLKVVDEFIKVLEGVIYMHLHHLELLLFLKFENNIRNERLRNYVKNIREQRYPDTLNNKRRMYDRLRESRFRVYKAQRYILRWVRFLLYKVLKLLAIIKIWRAESIYTICYWWEYFSFYLLASCMIFWKIYDLFVWLISTYWISTEYFVAKTWFLWRLIYIHPSEHWLMVQLRRPYRRFIDDTLDVVELIGRILDSIRWYCETHGIDLIVHQRDMDRTRIYLLFALTKSSAAKMRAFLLWLYRQIDSLYYLLLNIALTERFYEKDNEFFFKFKKWD